MKAKYIDHIVFFRTLLKWYELAQSSSIAVIKRIDHVVHQVHQDHTSSMSVTQVCKM